MISKTLSVVSDTVMQAEEKANEMKDKTIYAIKHLCEKHSQKHVDENSDERVKDEITIEELQAALDSGMMRIHRMPEQEVRRVKEKITSHLADQKEKKVN